MPHTWLGDGRPEGPTPVPWGQAGRGPWLPPPSRWSGSGATWPPAPQPAQEPWDQQLPPPPWPSECPWPCPAHPAGTGTSAGSARCRAGAAAPAQLQRARAGAPTPGLEPGRAGATGHRHHWAGFHGNREPARARTGSPGSPGSYVRSWPAWHTGLAAPLQSPGTLRLLVRTPQGPGTAAALALPSGCTGLWCGPRAQPAGTRLRPTVQAPPGASTESSPLPTTPRCSAVPHPH